jgi:hypothetical protein
VLNVLVDASGPTGDSINPQIERKFANTTGAGERHIVGKIANASANIELKTWKRLRITNDIIGKTKKIATGPDGDKSSFCMV